MTTADGNPGRPTTEIVPTRIFVKGLPYKFTEAQCRKHFAAKAPVTDLKYIARRRIAFVGYKLPEEATAAVKYFHRSYINTSRLDVELARPVSRISDR
jgi:multiple RNA-binding domain-containing protein 1